MKTAELTTPSKITTAAHPAPTRDTLLHHLYTSVAATIILLILCCAIYPLIVWGAAQLAFPIQSNGSLLKKDGAYTTNPNEAVGSALLGQLFSAPQYFHPRPSAAGNGYDAANSSGSNLGPISDKLLNGATATQPAVATATQPTETLAYDGLRLRTLHYAQDNNITFKLYTLNPNGARIEVPLSKFLDKDGNLNDLALVDAFPHANDPADKSPLIAADFSTLIPADAVTASASGLDPHISPQNAALQKPRIAKARHMTEDAVQKLIDENTDHPTLGLLGDPGVNVLTLNLALDKAAPMTK